MGRSSYPRGHGSYETPLPAALTWWLLSLPFRLAVYGVTRRRRDRGRCAAACYAGLVQRHGVAAHAASPPTAASADDAYDA
jgi:hypothetical protein